MEQSGIDSAIQTYYSTLFDEAARLTTRSAQGRLEFERTQAVVRASTPAPARILDVGGATGVHAAALAGDGYDVVLVDPVASHVEAAVAHGAFAAVLGDARGLQFPDGTFDAVLMAGPLYHIADREDRLRALREAHRVCRTGGFVHVAAIPRAGAFAVAAVDPGVLEADLEGWIRLLRHGTPVATSRFPAGHFHTPRELREEMADAGYRDITVRGLEGPAGVALESVPKVTDATYAAAIDLAVTFEHSADIQNFSNHLLATGTV